MSHELILPVKAAGILFKNPFYVASGPTARTVRQLLAIEKAGWAAASLKLAIDPAPYINRAPRYAVFPQYDALGFTAEKRLTFQQALSIVREAKQKLTDLVLMANITYAGDDDETGWARMAEAFCEAGADLIELNMCCPNMSFNVEATSGGARKAVKETGASIGRHPELVAQVVRAIKKAIDRPLIVKLCAEGGMMGHSAKAAMLAGADGICSTGNRLGMTPIDVERPDRSMIHLQDENSISCLCGGWLKPLAQRDIYELRAVLGKDVSLFATGGIRTALDAVEMAMCGGDMAGICTETLMRGYDFIGNVIRETKQWLAAHGHAGYGDIRDRIVAGVKAAPELTLYEGYARVKEPGRIAPCYAACPHGLPVQAVLGALSKNRMERAMALSAGAPCEGCSAPCETACAMGRIARGLSIREVMLYCAERAKAQGIAGAAVQKPAAAKVASANEVLGIRRVDLSLPKQKRITDDAVATLESGRCLACGCGEGCTKCAEACCEFAVQVDPRNGVSIDPSACVACGMCMNLCPNRNIEMVNTGKLV